MSLKLDREVVAYFRLQMGSRYQSGINAVLKAFVDAQRVTAETTSA